MMCECGGSMSVVVVSVGSVATVVGAGSVATVVGAGSVATVVGVGSVATVVSAGSVATVIDVWSLKQKITQTTHPPTESWFGQRLLLKSCT